LVHLFLILTFMKIVKVLFLGLDVFIVIPIGRNSWSGNSNACEYIRYSKILLLIKWKNNNLIQAFQ
jgi:hypothetical protein